MSSPLVECVPNFSEGRRPEVVDAIRQVIAEVKGVYVLDHHSDEDHNRSVITFVGSPDAVEEAAFQGIKKASTLIDLNEHEGEHPRIGATDVVPFIPISGVSMQDCVEMAERLGERVGNELNIPVYLYEKAATRPERKRLENIRRGEYEGLKQEIDTDTEREPDYGPLELGPAGATVIGAREFLIAYNVYLTTDDKTVADKIARAVRRSSGGLRYVKALGMLVDGRAQVSMNLTNFHRTPMARVMEFIRGEARRYGVAVHHSELVGLIPQEALVDAAVWYMQMDQFDPEQVLEQKLYAALEEEESSFLDRLAAGTPTPGGGSAAAQAAAMGAGLVSMVVRTTLGKRQYERAAEKLEIVLEESEELRDTLTSAVEEDAAAFKALMEAYRLPADNPGRSQSIQQATLLAARVPLKVMRDSLRVMSLALEVAKHGNLNAITDAATGLDLAHGALKSASYNVRINIQDLDDQKKKQSMSSELDELEKEAEHIQSLLEGVLRKRAQLFSNT